MAGSAPFGVNGTCAGHFMENIKLYCFLSTVQMKEANGFFGVFFVFQNTLRNHLHLQGVCRGRVRNIYPAFKSRAVIWKQTPS